MRVRPHYHPCVECGTKVECSGEWEANYDGWPDPVCPEWQQCRNAPVWERTMRAFRCDECHAKSKAAAARRPHRKAGRVA